MATDNDIGCRSADLDFTTYAAGEVKRFYTETLGFHDVHEDPESGHFSVHLQPGLRLRFLPPEPGPPERWRPPREPAFYLMVEDVDQVSRRLRERGVSFQQEPTDMPWGHRVAILRDPDGRSIHLASALPTT